MMNDSWHPSHPFTQRVSTLLLKMQTGRVRLEIVAVSVMHQNPANDKDETPWQVAFLTRISSALVSIPRRSEMGVGTGLLLFRNEWMDRWIDGRDLWAEKCSEFDHRRNHSSSSSSWQKLGGSKSLSNLFPGPFFQSRLLVSLLWATPVKVVEIWNKFGNSS